MENRVRVRRAELRVTQFEISRRAKINETKLSRIETGLIDPTADEVKALAKALGTTPADLFPTLAEQPSAEAL